MAPISPKVKVKILQPIALLSGLHPLALAFMLPLDRSARGQHIHQYVQMLHTYIRKESTGMSPLHGQDPTTILGLWGLSPSPGCLARSLLLTKTQASTFLPQGPIVPPPLSLFKS